MSRVTNLILKYQSMCYCDEIEKSLTTWFSDNRLGRMPISCDSEILPNGWYGGGKFLECEICVGAYNYLDINDFLKYMKTLPWKYPEYVQVMYQEQEDDFFTSWRLSDAA